MRNTKIVATIGPVTGSYKMISELAGAGMNVARLNMSHGDHESHRAVIQNVKRLNRYLKFPVAVLMDLQGASIRLQKLERPVQLKSGDEIVFGPGKGCIGVDNQDFHTFVRKGGFVYVDGGMVELRVKEVKDMHVVCDALNEGVIESRKSLNIPGSDYRPPGLTGKDMRDLKFGIENDVDFVGLSFAREAEHVRAVKNAIGKGSVRVVAKIENMEAVTNFDSILDAADGIMVARGDLGMETELEKLPLLQYDIIRKCNDAGKPVITATHMLNSMMHNPVPTRAEVMDVSNAIFMGSDAVMLSGETATGRFPARSVRMMDSIARQIETRVRQRDWKRGDERPESRLAKAVVLMGNSAGAKAILCVTESGVLSRNISRLRSHMPVFTFTANKKVMKEHLLVWGNFPYPLAAGNAEKAVREGLEVIKKRWGVNDGDRIIVAGDGSRVFAEVRSA